MLTDTREWSGPRNARGPDHPGEPDRPVRAWPLLVLAMPAAVAVWSGWVGIGEMTGFGMVRPLPGIWDSLQVNTAVTLPVGVEAYAGMALRAWLASNALVSQRTRQFARRSAIGALVLGIIGQVAYHLLAEARVTRAPWIVTTLVASLPVLVLGLGTALAHMLRADACTVDRDPQVVRPGCESGPSRDGLASGTQMAFPATDHSDGKERADGDDSILRLREAMNAADALTEAGQRVSRRNLRAAGMRGSNTELARLARLAQACTGTRTIPAAPKQ